MEIFVNKTHESLNNINSTAQYLNDLSYHFRMTGNDVMSKELKSCAEYLLEESRKIRNELGAVINRQLKESQDSLANTVKLSLEKILKKG